MGLTPAEIISEYFRSAAAKDYGLIFLVSWFIIWLMLVLLFKKDGEQ